MLTRNGRHAYVSAVNSSAIVAFTRDKKTGALTQLAAPNGCVSAFGDGVHCRPALALQSVFSLVMPNDAKHLYATSFSESSIGAFAREK